MIGSADFTYPVVTPAHRHSNERDTGPAAAFQAQPPPLPRPYHPPASRPRHTPSPGGSARGAGPNTCIPVREQRRPAGSAPSRRPALPTAPIRCPRNRASTGVARTRPRLSPRPRRRDSHALSAVKAGNRRHKRRADCALAESGRPCVARASPQQTRRRHTARAQKRRNSPTHAVGASAADWALRVQKCQLMTGLEPATTGLRVLCSTN